MYVFTRDIFHEISQEKRRINMITITIYHPMVIPSVILQLGSTQLIFGYTVYMDVYFSLSFGVAGNATCPSRVKIEFVFETDAHTSIAQIRDRCEHIRASYEFLALSHPWLFAYDYRYIDIQEWILLSKKSHFWDFLIFSFWWTALCKRAFITSWTPRRTHISPKEDDSMVGLAFLWCS